MIMEPGLLTTNQSKTHKFTQLAGHFSTEINNQRFSCFRSASEDQFVLKLIKPSLKGWNELIFYSKQLENGHAIASDFVKTNCIDLHNKHLAEVDGVRNLTKMINIAP